MAQGEGLMCTQNKAKVDPYISPAPVRSVQ